MKGGIGASLREYGGEEVCIDFGGHDSIEARLSNTFRAPLTASVALLYFDQR